MIGQELLIKNLSNYLPKNIIIVGEKFSGKKTLVYEIAKIKNLEIKTIENNVFAIREISSSLYKNIIYLFADIDIWSKASFSALLKLLEENSQNYFILTCRNIQNLPDTVVSRCIVYYMEQYTADQIGNNYCNNIGQTKLYSEELLNFVDKIIDRIDNTHISNVFNIENQLKLKESDNGFDFELFFTVLENRLYYMITRMSLEGSSVNPKDFIDRLNRFFYITSKYNSGINLKSLNKQKYLWNWILDMRGVSDGYKTI